MGNILAGEQWIFASVPQKVERFYENLYGEDKTGRIRYAPVHFPEGSEDANNWKRKWLESMERLLDETVNTSTSSGTCTIYVIAIEGGGMGCKEERQHLTAEIAQIRQKVKSYCLPHVKVHFVKCDHDDFKHMVEQGKSGLVMSVERIGTKVGSDDCTIM